MALFFQDLFLTSLLSLFFKGNSLLSKPCTEKNVKLIEKCTEYKHYTTNIVVHSWGTKNTLRCGLSFDNNYSLKEYTRLLMPSI
jgi:hypothetical protein